MGNERKRSLPPRPWTRGPWELVGSRVMAGDEPVAHYSKVHVEPSERRPGTPECWHTVIRREDAALIARAPEMAEAIITYYELASGPTPFDALAEQLLGWAEG